MAARLEAHTQPPSNAAVRAGIRCAALLQRGVGQGAHSGAYLPHDGRLRKRRRLTTIMRNPKARGLLLTDSLCMPYTAAPSAVVQPIMSLRSSHLLHDHGFSYGLRGCRDTCRLCLAQVYDLPVEFDADHPEEHRWRHGAH